MRLAMDFQEQEAYARAKKKVEAIKGFYWNLCTYMIVIPFLIFVNYMTSWDFHWFWFPMFGWGTGLTIHGLSVLTNIKFLGKEWEDRKMKEFLKKEQQSRQRYE